MYSLLVHNFLENSAERYAQRDAFSDHGKWFKFHFIEEQANRLAHALLALGVRKQDRVAFLLENSVDYVVTYYGVLKSGAITVALNTELTADNIDYILDDCEVRVVLVSKKLAKRIRPLMEENPAKRHFLVWGEDADSLPVSQYVHLVDGLLKTQPAGKPAVRLIDLDIASIVYTSGSTGKPRGATLSHLNIVTNTRSIVDYLHLTHEDRVMAILPFYYIYGKSLLNTHFFVGASVVIDNRFLYPNVILKTMHDEHVTGFSGVPSTFTILLHRSNLRSYTFPYLRYVTQAGGAMAPAVQKEVADVFAPARLFVMYGATEASARLSYLEPEALTRKWGSIGKGIPNVDLFIADEDGKELSQGQEGEIVARGANIMSGYWNHPKETHKVLRHGLYYTGDIGRMDEEGFLFVVGRSKDMIKIGGNRASAKEIEDVLYEHKAVADAAVIGVADEVLGEAPKAFIVLKKGHTEAERDDLLKHARSRLAAYKVPKYLEFRDNLPKNESGKIQKLQLSREEAEKN